ncbi:MAG: 3-dehydroquinate synthase [Romboutsia sp.]
MEKIENRICSIIIDYNYKSFNIEKDYDGVVIITDQNVYTHQVDKLISNIKSKMIYEYVIVPGENSKSLEVYEEIMKYLTRINLSRKSLIIAVGGGVVGDISGFVASTYMRGIDIIQVPTTLLAQVDSSVGGKTGINLGNFKNIIGSFYQPTLTYISISALKTLPEKEFLDGISEVIKYSLIYDYSFLEYLIKYSEEILERETINLYEVVKKCISIKAHIVEKDEKESDLRKILNFGHTFGHGVEKLGNISHGEAVAIGMNMAFKLSFSENLVGEDYYNKFLEVCTKYKLNLGYYDLDENKILQIMKIDKKNSFAKINLVLPVGFGKVQVIDYIDEGKILEIIKRCKNA